MSIDEEDDPYVNGEETPAVLTDDVCLVPGEPIVRVERAPDNSRRIFTGVDIIAPVDAVWETLTDYEGLHKVVPSLVENTVLSRNKRGGARLLQIGGANVLPGVTFTAKTVLDVDIYLESEPIADSCIANHLDDDASEEDVRSFDSVLPLQRGIFPRPYAITQLPHRDITMQNVEGEGDFDHYQGIWRLQNLPNCAPDGKNDAMRLTYAVEIKPRGMLPVRLIEQRIATDLKANLKAIKKHVEEGLAHSAVSESAQNGGQSTSEPLSMAQTRIRELEEALKERDLALQNIRQALGTLGRDKVN